LFRKLHGNVASVITAMGWADGSFYLASRLLGLISASRIRLHKYYFLSQPVQRPALLPPGRGASIAVHRVFPEDAEVAQFPRPASVIAQRFANGGHCYAAVSDNVFLGFLWVQEGTYREDEVRCRFTPLPRDRTVWDFDVHVQPGLRGGLVFARLWDTVNHVLFERGVGWSVSRVSAFNPPSINSHRRLGAFPIGSAYFVAAWGFQLMVASESPYFHVSFAESSCPELCLSAGERKYASRFAPSAPINPRPGTRQRDIDVNHQDRSNVPRPD
jgi:hypothetical protein